MAEAFREFIQSLIDSGVVDENELFDETIEDKEDRKLDKKVNCNCEEELEMDNETLDLIETDLNDEEGDIEIIYKKDSPKSLEFTNVIGHSEQKKELALVVDWFNHSKELREKGISIPKGIVLFGDPGNGKSLLIKEIINSVDAPVFVLKGEAINLVDSIISIFNKAKEAGHSIIVIDELDLLINRERRITRALQECLDGVESCDDILVLTATNDIKEIPDPLLRTGRLEKLMEIPYPSGEEASCLMKKIFNDFNVKFPEDYDEEELCDMLSDVSCSDIKSIVNDIVLRNGFDNITVKNVDDSILNITKRVKSRANPNYYQVAVHEAGHAVMGAHFPQFFQITKLNFNGSDGVSRFKEIDQYFCSYDKAIADIKISMAGVIAEKIICKVGSRGCERDLNRARSVAYNLINIVGYSTCADTLSAVGSGRPPSQIKLRHNERKIERILRRCERQVYFYILTHKKQVKAIAQALFEKKNLKYSEVAPLLN